MQLPTDMGLSGFQCTQDPKLASRRLLECDPDVRKVAAESERDIKPRERAKAVFRVLDSSNAGSITSKQLSSVLVQWGCPHNEVARYFQRYDFSGDGKLCFDEFFVVSPAYLCSCYY